MFNNDMSNTMMTSFGAFYRGRPEMVARHTDELANRVILEAKARGIIAINESRDGKLRFRHSRGIVPDGHALLVDLIFECAARVIQ